MNFMKSFENQEKSSPESFWTAFSRENLNLKPSSGSSPYDQEKCKRRNLMREDEKENQREILVEKQPNTESPILSLSGKTVQKIRRRPESSNSGVSLMQKSQSHRGLKSLDLNFSSQKTSKKINFLSSNQENSSNSSQNLSHRNNYHHLYFRPWTKARTAEENECTDPTRYVQEGLEYMGNLKLNSFPSQVSQPPDSDLLGEFEGEFVMIGKEEYTSEKDGKEKVRALIAKELESFVHAGIVGQGCFSEVELTFDKETKKFYAMKRYPKQEKEKKIDDKMAENEYQILKKIMLFDDPDLLHVKIACYTPQKSLIVLMEYAMGGTLETLLSYIADQKEKGNLKKKNLWSQRDLQIFYQQMINQIIKLASIGIFHCDIKCDNIILRDNGRFALSDYGCSKMKTDYNQKQLEKELRANIKNIDVFKLIQTIRWIMVSDNSSSKLSQIKTSPDDLSLVNETVSFYENIKDRYKIDQFKYPFQDIETAYENILKFTVYFNTKEIVKYLQAEFDNTPPEDHRKLQAFYFFFGEILLREGFLQQAFLRFQKSEQELKAIGNEINYTRAAHLYRKLALINKDLSYFLPANRYLQISMQYYLLALHSNQIALQQIQKQDQTQEQEKQVQEQKKQIVEHKKQIARTFSWLASLNLDHGNLVEAERLYQEAIDILELLERDETSKQQEAHSKDFYLMNLYHSVGTCCKQRGQFKKALKLTKISIPKYREAAGLIHPLTGLSVYFLGRIYQQLSDFEAALKCYRISKRIFTESFHHKHHYYANTLIQMAAIYYMKGEKVRALIYYAQSFVILTKTDLRLPYEFYLKYMIAMILIDLKIFEKTAQHFLNWFIIQYLKENSENQYIISKVWVNLEYGSKINHNFTLATKIYHRRMKLIAEDPSECPCFPLILLQIARNHIVHKNKSQYRNASQLLEKVLTKMKKRMFAYFPSEFETCYYYLGKIYYEQEMYERSHHYFQKCLEIRRLLYRKEAVYVSNEEDCLLFLCQLEDALLTKYREFSIEASRSILIIYDQ